MNDLEKAIEFKESLHTLIGLDRTKSNINEETYTSNRTYFVQKYGKKVPQLIFDSRTITSFETKLKEVAYGGGSWQARRKLIEESFNEFLEFLELKSLPALSNNQFSDNDIKIIINSELYSHIAKLLKEENYYHAIEESYKFVREKLKSITGHEKATDAFAEKNTKIIFGHEPTDQAEEDYFKGIKFLHMSTQFLRNEKFHSLANEMQENLAMQFIILANLAYELIDR